MGVKIEIEVNGCHECPFYGSRRYGYCRRKHPDDVQAYQDGFYAEYSSELKWMFDNCPFRKPE